ncbi:MAG: TIR domain-containing protein [Gammaproteobacteria bacterium]|nr:TIR domain-containing protein [Gammaproteobacteria bacterium]
MARHVFFSFQFSEDNSRAEVVRNSWVTKRTQTAAGFFDRDTREELKRQSSSIIKKWIRASLKGTSVTAVLVGSKTCDSRWVKFEIEESKKRGNGLLEIDISKIKNFEGKTSRFCGWVLPDDYAGYGWNKHNGHDNFGDWVEKAYRQANPE